MASDYEVLLERLAVGSSRHSKLAAAADSLLSLFTACRSSGMAGTINEEHEVLKITSWVQGARLGSIEKQKLLSALEQPSDSMLMAFSELIAAGLEHLCGVDASSLLQQHAAAMHNLGLLCVALAACMQFWCSAIVPEARGGIMATRIKMSTQLASSGKHLRFVCGAGLSGRAMHAEQLCCGSGGRCSCCRSLKQSSDAVD